MKIKLIGGTCSLLYRRKVSCCISNSPLAGRYLRKGYFYTGLFRVTSDDIVCEILSELYPKKRFKTRHKYTIEIVKQKNKLRMFWTLIHELLHWVGFIVNRKLYTKWDKFIDRYL